MLHPPHPEKKEDICVFIVGSLAVIWLLLKLEVLYIIRWSQISLNTQLNILSEKYMSFLELFPERVMNGF